MRLLLLILWLLPLAHAGVGEVISIKGGTDSFLVRNGQKMEIAAGTPLEVGDLINSASTYVTLVLNPKIQMGLATGTEFLITEHSVDITEGSSKTNSLIDLVKGIIRIQVTRDTNEELNQKVDARGVNFTVRGTEYEVSSTPAEAELDVFEGEVEVSSPHVQTLVPEIVKPKEGFRYGRKGRQFERRAFRERLKEIRFLRKEELRERWQKRRAFKQERKANVRNRIKARREERRERKSRGR